jgi:hypothetical protein
VVASAVTVDVSVVSVEVDTTVVVVGVVSVTCGERGRVKVDITCGLDVATADVTPVAAWEPGAVGIVIVTTIGGTVEVAFNDSSPPGVGRVGRCVGQLQKVLTRFLYATAARYVSFVSFFNDCVLYEKHIFSELFLNTIFIQFEVNVCLLANGEPIRM